jgi:hypothetical protein
MKTLLLVSMMLLSACGDGTPDPEGDEYVKCSNFCGEDGVREFKKSDSGYNCYCYNMRKA